MFELIFVILTVLTIFKTIAIIKEKYNERL